MTLFYPFFYSLFYFLSFFYPLFTSRLTHVSLVTCMISCYHCATCSCLAFNRSFLSIVLTHTLMNTCASSPLSLPVALLVNLWPNSVSSLSFHLSFSLSRTAVAASSLKSHTNKLAPSKESVNKVKVPPQPARKHCIWKWDPTKTHLPPFLFLLSPSLFKSHFHTFTCSPFAGDSIHWITCSCLPSPGRPSKCKSAGSAGTVSPLGKVWIRAQQQKDDQAAKATASTTDAPSPRPASLTGSTRSSQHESLIAEAAAKAAAATAAPPGPVKVTDIKTPEEATGIKSPEPESWTVEIEPENSLIWTNGKDHKSKTSHTVDSAPVPVTPQLLYLPVCRY